MTNIQTKILKTFLAIFGKTPTQERLEDINRQATNLFRASSLEAIREKTGNVLCSTIQLCSEMGWDYKSVIDESLDIINKRKLQYQTLGRKKRVAILGGAFDPITRGHEEVAKFVLNCSKIFDYVWLMPCYNHLYGKKMVRPRHRLEMCELVTHSDNRISVFPFEITNHLGGETYKTIKMLLDSELASMYDFSLIIGQDNANSFDKWVNFTHLEKMIRFVVVPRKGEDRDERVDWYLKAPHIYMSPDNPIPRISSTEIRHALKHKKDKRSKEVLLNNINPLVLEYIEKNSLYS